MYKSLWTVEALSQTDVLLLQSMTMAMCYTLPVPPPPLLPPLVAVLHHRGKQKPQYINLAAAAAAAAAEGRYVTRPSYIDSYYTVP